MSRGRKLLIVSVVLILGCVLAWPFRKTGDKEASPEFLAAAETSMIGSSADNMMTQPTFEQKSNASDNRPQLGMLTPPVSAKQASMTEGQGAGYGKIETRTPRQQSPPPVGFDLANHPALTRSLESPVTPNVPPTVQQPLPSHHMVAKPVAPNPPITKPQLHGSSRPAYMIPEDEGVFDPHELRREDLRHIVQNSDTLERIAKRYLGDESRALEIFDLNRDVLDNPHLLPIEAELRLPADAKVTVD